MFLVGNLSCFSHIQAWNSCVKKDNAIHVDLIKKEKFSMATIAPFRAVRPKPELASQVAAPPYDVVSLGEARDLAEGNPHCFLRIGRAELELNDGVDPYSAEVYQKGADNLRKLINEGVLVQEPKPLFGVYRQKWEQHEQTGIVALASRIS